MIRRLEFKDGIIPGDIVRDMIKIFYDDGIDVAFQQRKSFDEYYWDRGKLNVELSLDKIQQLNDMFYEVKIGSKEVLILN
jgi:hypothetical protein